MINKKSEKMKADFGKLQNESLKYCEDSNILKSENE